MNLKPEQIPGEAVSAAMTAYATSCDRGVYEDAIRHAIAAALPVLLGEAVGGWQPIETAPRDGTPVDLWYEGHRLTNYSWEQLSPTNGFFSPNWAGISVVRDATHWMPIPEPPATKRGATLPTQDTTNEHV